MPFKQTNNLKGGLKIQFLVISKYQRNNMKALTRTLSKIYFPKLVKRRIEKKSFPESFTAVNYKKNLRFKNTPCIRTVTVIVT